MRWAVICYGVIARILRVLRGEGGQAALNKTPRLLRPGRVLRGLRYILGAGQGFSLNGLSASSAGISLPSLLV